MISSTSDAGGGSVCQAPDIVCMQFLFLSQKHRGLHAGFSAGDMIPANVMARCAACAVLPANRGEPARKPMRQGNKYCGAEK
jgi:hypothetical protein